MKILLLLALVTLCGCTTQLKYTAMAPTEVKKGQKCDATILDSKYLTEYEYDVVVNRKGHAIACGFTAIFYGGYCWAYLAMPYEYQKDIAKKYGRERILARLNLPNNTPLENCIIRESVIKAR